MASHAGSMVSSLSRPAIGGAELYDPGLGPGGEHQRRVPQHLKVLLSGFRVISDWFLCGFQVVSMFF